MSTASMNAASRDESAIQSVAIGRVPALDGVRGLAILIVLIHNVSWVLQSSSWLPLKLVAAVTATGWIGVQLFFVLSGFLITSILLATRTSRHYLRNFYVRRALRIFPLYYGVLVPVLLIGPWFGTAAWSAAVHENQWWLWTFTSNWGGPLGRGVPGLPHFWSLAVEEQFYLVWPFLVLATSRRGLIMVCIATLLATPFIRIGLLAAGLPVDTAYEFTIARWDALAGGALVALLVTTESGSTWLAKWLPRAGTGSSVAIALFAAVTHGFHQDEFWAQVVGQSLTVVAFAWLVYAAFAPRTGIERALCDGLTSRWLRFLGKYSYAIYVFHAPFHQIASTYVGSFVTGADTPWRLLRWALYVASIGAASIAAALCSWHVLEKRFLGLKDRFTR
jgi:peptidoglycan/LPS O-acetylase OafA/YrhL